MLWLTTKHARQFTQFCASHAHRLPPRYNFHTPCSSREVSLKCQVSTGLDDRVREAERAPPLVVLSLPERVWSPDIVWEKDSDSETNSTPTTPRIDSTASSDPTQTSIPPPPHITPSEISTPPPFDIPEPIASGSKNRKSQAGVNAHSGKKYFGKDECAICMDSFHRGEIVRILPCGHVFHKDECDEWLLKWRKLVSP